MEIIPSKSNQPSHDVLRRATIAVVAGSPTAVDALHLGKRASQLDNNEFSQMIEISSSEFSYARVGAENLAGLVHEHVIATSDIPILRVLVF